MRGGLVEAPWGCICGCFIHILETLHLHPGGVGSAETRMQGEMVLHIPGDGGADPHARNLA